MTATMEFTASGKGRRSYHVLQNGRDIGGRMTLDNGRIDEDVAFEKVLHDVRLLERQCPFNGNRLIVAAGGFQQPDHVLRVFVGTGAAVVSPRVEI